MKSILQWEYHVLTLGSTFSQPKDEDVEATLNELGEEGWEVVAVSNQEGSNKVRIVAKRPLSTSTRRRRSWPDPV
jgi:hypothetical protein